MILARKLISTSHWQNYGCFTPNIAFLNGQSDSVQEDYLELVKSAFPNLPGAVPWVRGTRYGIEVTAAYPNWNVDLTRYWPNMYFRPAIADFMTGRYVMFEPLLWVRQNAGTPVMCTPNAGPNYFGRDAAGVQVVDDASNTWRLDIRKNLDRLMTGDVGSSGGEPYVTRAKYTNYRNLLILGPNEIDHWGNARLYYVADDEVSVATSGLPIFSDYNIDSRVSGNILPRLMQEGDPGYSVGWNSAGATVIYQRDHTVSEGDGLRITFANYSGSYAIQAGGSISIGGTPASLTFSAYMQANGAASLAGVQLQVDWFNGATYLSASNATFTVTATAMSQYSFTATRPATATNINILIMRNVAGGVLDVDFVVVRSSATLPTPSVTSQAQSGAWVKVLDDDFNTFDTTNWTKAVAYGWTDTYGQGQVMQWNDNLVTVANSRLRITAQLINGLWNSGCIVSKSKRSYLYGYFEAHIKLTPGNGMFPAWWLMPITNTYGGWPKSGELDIMEAIGLADLTSGHGTFICDRSPEYDGYGFKKSVTARGVDYTADFHTWGLLWEKSIDNRVILRWYIDNVPYGMYDQSEWPPGQGGPAGSPFDQPFHMIINLGIGGPWAGAPTADASGSFIEVDWVRVWQRSGSTLLLSQNFSTGYTIDANWGEGTTVGSWFVNFLGLGYARVVNAGSPRLELCPGDVDVVGGTTRATLVTTTDVFTGDIQVSVDMLLIAQLRNTAPNAWESPWLIWHCTSSAGIPTGANYLALKTNGWELGLILGGDAQAFIATGALPTVSAAFQTVRIRQVSKTVEVFIGGVQLDLSVTGGGSPITDSRFYTSGNVGLYTEDAQVQFDNLTVYDI